MSEDKPLLTMTTSRIVGEMPELSDKSRGLMETLKGLCSFHSSEDLASFLFTEMFREFVGTGEPWIIFEIGVYLDHTQTLELIPVHDGVTLADAAMTGYVPNHILVAKQEGELSNSLQKWHDGVMTE